MPQPKDKELREKIRHLILLAWYYGHNSAHDHSGKETTLVDKLTNGMVDLLDSERKKAREQERREIMREVGAVFVNWNKELNTTQPTNKERD